MPILGASLDFAKLEARNMRMHQLSAAPSSPVEGQLYYDTVGHTLYWYDGSQWQSAKGGVGAPPDASTSAKGIVQLAGDLSGTAAAPTIAAGAVTDTKVAAANKDGVAGTASMRTLGTGAQQAMRGSSSLDQIATANVVGAPVNLNGQTIFSLGNPGVAQDAATKAYVDNSVQGLDAKQSCKAATTGSSITLAGSAPSTLDGVTLAANDRVLVKDQSGTTQNGIYTVSTLGTGANGTWTRAVDADTWLEFPGAFTWVEQGTVNADTGWVCTVDQGGTLGTSAITWTQFSGAAMITAGTGLTKTGNTLSASVDGTTIDAAGAGSSLEVKDGGITNVKISAVDGSKINNASLDPVAKFSATVSIGLGGTAATTAPVARANLGVPGYYSNSATHGAGTTITITQATHGLRISRAIHVQVQDNTTGAVELPDVVVASNGDVTVTYAASVSANSKLVTLVG